MPHVDACYDELMFLFRRSATLSRLRSAEAMFAAAEWSDDAIEVSNPDNLIQVSQSLLLSALSVWYPSRKSINQSIRDF